MPDDEQTIDGVRRENARLVRRFIDAINDAWNIDAMRALVSEEFRFVIPFAPTWFQVRHEGRDAALAFLDGVRHPMEPENLQ
jgi:ketosteroid isomerase-like protein